MQRSSGYPRRVRAKAYRGWGRWWSFGWWRSGGSNGKAGGGGWTSALLFTLALCGTTALYYVAIRAHNVELTFDQQLALERATHVLANRTVYLSRGDEDLLQQLGAGDWGKVSKRVEWVVFNGGGGVPSRQVVTAMATAFGAFRPPGLGVVQFACGCAVPNAYVRRARVRFGGAECLMLPGFVFPSVHVAWVDGDSGGNAAGGARKPCRVAAPRDWYANHEHKLVSARDEFATIREELIELRAEELRKINAKR